MSSSTIFAAILAALTVGVVGAVAGVLTNWLSSSSPPSWLTPPRMVLAIAIGVVIAGATPILAQLASADQDDVVVATPTSIPTSATIVPTSQPTVLPSTTPVSQPGSNSAATCFSYGDSGGSRATVIPNAQASTHDVLLDSASFTLNGQVRPPDMLIAGKVVGRPPAGMHLWIVGNPDPRTRDQEGHPGSGRFYPSAELRPDQNGCWKDAESIGYDEALGITVQQLVVQVDDAASAEFSNRSQHPDGLSEGDLSRLGVDTIAFFSVPTAS